MDVGSEWMRSVRCGEFERAWQISDNVLRQHKNETCEDLPLHERWVWRGQSAAKKRVLVRCFHGLGDTIQFVRYAPLVKAQGGVVVVECHKPLLPLLKSCAGVDTWVARGSVLRPFDVQAPLLSLPGMFGTTLATVPAGIPYLSADADRVAYWGSILRDRQSFRIGIAWQGNPDYREDRQRSEPPGQQIAVDPSAGALFSEAVDRNPKYAAMAPTFWTTTFSARSSCRQKAAYAIMFPIACSKYTVSLADCLPQKQMSFRHHFRWGRYPASQWPSVSASRL